MEYIQGKSLAKWRETEHPPFKRQIEMIRDVAAAVHHAHKSSVIHRDLVASLRARAGRVFGSAYPDVYSAFAFGYVAGEYLSTEVPMSVAGLSGASNGVVR